MSIKSLFYKAGLMKRVHLKTPVISVGNLTFGGTGKTPVIQLILDHLTKTNAKVVVVSRNYKGSSKKSVRVDLSQKKAAKFYGDEPVLIALSYPMVPVYVGPNKWESARLAEKEVSPDLILVDDGFQHHALERDLDIVLLDATAKFSEYRVFPLGRARESKKALKRADVIFLTKSNLASEEKLKHLHAFAKSNSKSDVKIFEIEFHIDMDQEKLKVGPVVGFAGIAKPKTFEKMIEKILGNKQAQFLEFSDHHNYSEADIKKILETARRQKAQALVTTEKDWVKIKEFKIDIPVMPVGLKTQIRNSGEEFYAILDQTLHSNH